MEIDVGDLARWGEVFVIVESIDAKLNPPVIVKIVSGPCTGDRGAAYMKSLTPLVKRFILFFPWALEWSR